MELPAFDPSPDASVWEAKPLDLVVRDEVEAPLGDAHDLRINRAHVGHGTRGVSQRDRGRPATTAVRRIPRGESANFHALAATNVGRERGKFAGTGQTAPSVAG